MVSVTKTDKITRILILYHQLSSGQHINKSFFSWEHGINERSFDRDIEDIRLFLSEIYSTREVLFNKDTGTYFLTGDTPTFMDRMDAAIIAKLLLSSKVLRKDEIDGLYRTLLTKVTPADAVAINDYLQHDLQQYSSNTQMALLKMIGDLFVAIYHKKKLQLTIHNDEASVVVAVMPQEIVISGSVAYLKGKKIEDSSKEVQYPLDQIESFRNL